MKDARYTIDLEFCGCEKPKYVLRFCGDWVDKFSSRKEAQAKVDQLTEKQWYIVGKTCCYLTAEQAVEKDAEGPFSSQINAYRIAKNLPII